MCRGPRKPARSANLPAYAAGHPCRVDRSANASILLSCPAADLPISSVLAAARQRSRRCTVMEIASTAEDDILTTRLALCVTGNLPAACPDVSGG
jgi:hypothetical protein